MYGQIIEEDVKRLDGREGGGKIPVHDLEEMLRFPQILEAVGSQIPQAYPLG